MFVLFPVFCFLKIGRTITTRELSFESFRVSSLKCRNLRKTGKVTVNGMQIPIPPFRLQVSCDFFFLLLSSSLLILSELSQTWFVFLLTILEKFRNVFMVWSPIKSHTWEAFCLYVNGTHLFPFRKLVNNNLLFNGNAIMMFLQYKYTGACGSIVEINLRMGLVMYSTTYFI